MVVSVKYIFLFYPGFFFPQDHLVILIQGLREFLPEQNKDPIQKAMQTLKEEVDFDGNAIHQIQLALYLFQDAVNAVLRLHSIKPHWMFALDNLVRSAVQAAITILSPGNCSCSIISCKLQLWRIHFFYHRTWRQFGWQRSSRQRSRRR